MFSLEMQSWEEFPFLFPQFATLMFKILSHLPQKLHRVENTFLLTYFLEKHFLFFTKETHGVPLKIYDDSPSDASHAMNNFTFVSRRKVPFYKQL